MTGQTISHYRVLEKVGEGGMGVVWKAHDIELDRVVALKSTGARMYQEARAASALNHPNIVTIYDLLHHEGETYLVMEFVDGKTLDRAIPRNGLALGELQKLAVPIASALNAAHKAGIVHRDLKPGNIMVTADGTVKVLDFGLAKRVDSGSSGGETQTMEGTIVGTVSYMSPEQAEGKSVDTRSDIFSFGCVLYEMASGRKAFLGDSKLATMSAILREEPAPLQNVPADLEKTIARCLRKDPKRRTQHIGDVRIALEEVENAAPVIVKKTLRWPWAVAAVALLAIAAWKFIPRETAAPQRLITVTSYDGIEEQPSLSPDGNQVAFIWTGNDGKGRGIFVKLVGSAGDALRLTAASDSYPRFSPDGQSIAFARRDEPAGYYVVSALGGTPRRIADIVNSPKTLIPASDWTPDGKNLLIIDGSYDPPSIAVVPATGGAPKRITTPPKETWGDQVPQISPDGRRLAFRRRMNNGGTFELRMASWNGDSIGVESLLRTQYGGTSLCWSPDSGHVLQTDRVGNERHLMRIPISRPDAATVVEAAGTNAVEPTAALRARRVAFARRQYDTNLWRLPLDSIGTPERVYGSSQQEFQAEYSPDGARIVVGSQQTGDSEIWIVNTDGSGAVQLHTNLKEPLRPRWSPDGKWIVFAARPENNVDVYAVSASGGAPRRLTSHPMSDASARFSNDGKFVYFSSTRTGRPEIFKTPFDGSSPEVQVTRNGGQSMAESPDGKHLIFGKNDRGLYRMPLAGGAEEKITDYTGSSTWNIAGNSIYYALNGHVWVHSLATGHQRKLRELPSRWLGNTAGFSITPDGKWLLYAQADIDTSDIYVLDNFK
ncbi:MAG: DUF5050 domain-containing protein [Acidobacteria bacterium]|nr:DUF5050 domain-containing protein [Acidobacteriota bacterium]